MQLPYIFQIRENCIINFPDRSYLVNNRKNETVKHTKIDSKKTFTVSAKKRMGKILNIWQYTIKNTETNLSFVTLTLSSPQKKELNYFTFIKKWIEKINLRYGNPNYVWKLEYQKNGNLHYHVILDTTIDWKIARSQWNKIQKIHVDDYQIKMKWKYRNGFYFDKEMKDYTGKSVDEETQKKRYEKGYKANWRNPNSTDVKIIDTKNNVGAYINKYINKEESEENQSENNYITRHWGCSDKLRAIKYPQIEEDYLTVEEIEEITKKCIKKIEDEHYNVLCYIYEKNGNSTLKEVEENQLKKNREILKNIEVEKKRETKNLKEINMYNKLYGNE